MTGSHWMTVDDAMLHFKLSRSAIYQLARRRNWRRTRIGRTVHYASADVLDTPYPQRRLHP